MRRRMWVAAFPLALLATMFAQLAALANVFPGNNDRRVADDSIHTYCLTSTFVMEEHKLVPEYAMYWLDQTTDLSDQAQACLSATDAWWYKADLPAGIRGSRSCVVVEAIGICDRSNLSIDFVEVDIGANDWEDRRKTACHELGHSVGLGHDTVSCMVSGEIPNIAEQWRRYSGHDISHMNAQY